MSTKPKYYIVESSALPEVFLKVAEAKRLLSTGEASTVNEATRMTDISRSAFYKYRDAVLPFQSMMTGRIITFQLLLHDEQGLLSEILGVFADAGANISTINSIVPTNGTAVVTISAETIDLTMTLEELMNRLSAIQGVLKADVLAAAGVGAPAAAEAAACESCESNDLPPVKVNPLRRSIAANMSASWTTSPRVTYTRPVDASAMKELRSRLKDTLKEQGIKLTFNHILMKVAAQTLMEFPDVNASFADNMLTRHRHANVGLAVAKGDGLIVPNVKSCDTKSLAQIAKETEALIEATRSGKLSMEDMTGGTFTISSLGPYGITSFSPIINQPELAILGVCDMVDTPVVRNGEIVIRPMMNLSLTADHRVIDGVMAAKFLKRMAELLENPYLLLI